ncbi:MBL fold metallo-hydrolase [Lichenihabitans sp. Uapishka_5]|uniref:MBL fold metallo-hydrolase n=1 Tax=Lichenihabitans sp. Uapishka_5 TaxID=3037302 RepID=UPI0029E7EE2C|nr:MBL fold metallo-hydrolase [Lichenihabitans sp. Uapishka_5]MDX7951829.1 MBL fold metallo-hydrolase [Lichenihabitans sp. Uapishka_5]
MAFPKMFQAVPTILSSRAWHGWVVPMAICALLGAELPAMAGAPQLRTQAPGYYRFMLGDFEVTALLDGTHGFPAYAVLQRMNGTGGADLLEKAEPGTTDALLGAVDLKAPPEGSINGFLVNTGKQLVLIDAGAGSFYGACCGRLLSNLLAAGYRADQVDVVLLTHLHMDHVGGILKDDHAAFPNATVRVSRRDADYWLDASHEPNAPANLLPMFGVARKALQPYRDGGRFSTFEDGAEVLPGIRAIATPGHTPGHSSYLVESRGQRLLAWGDVVHVAPVQFPRPDVTVTYDSDARSAERSRDALYAEAAGNGEWVAAAHIGFPGLGHVRRDGDRFMWVPANYTTVLTPPAP